MPKAKAPKPASLGDNLRIHFRDGLTEIFLSVRQASACREVLHLVESIGKVQPIDPKLAAAAASVAEGLKIMLAKMKKGNPNQPELPGLESDKE